MLLSRFIKPGSINDTAYNHYSMLRSVEDIFALEHLGFAGQAGLQPFGSDVYNMPPPPPPQPRDSSSDTGARLPVTGWAVPWWPAAIIAASLGALLWSSRSWARARLRPMRRSE